MNYEYIIKSNTKYFSLKKIEIIMSQKFDLFKRSE